MEVDLRSLAQRGDGASASFFGRVDVEAVIARSFAASLNALSGAEGRSSFSVAFRFPDFSGKEANAAVGWTRKLKDDVARCVDRALTRVYPPMDSLRYLSGDSPRFVSEKAEGQKGTSCLTVVFQLVAQPSGVRGVSQPHYCMEGEDEAGSLQPSFISGRASSDPEAFVEAGDAKRLVEKDNGHRSAEDEELWQLVRASRGKASALPAEDARLQSARHLKLLRRLARHITERLVNERSWASPVSAAAPSAGAQRGAASRRPPSRHLASLFTSQRPSKVSDGGRSGAHDVRHRSVVEAAASASGRRATAASRIDGGDDVGNHSETKTVKHGVVHVDVRGVEFTGVVAVRSARFAYIACRAGAGPTRPHDSPAVRAEEGGLVLVARVPVPSWLGEGPRAEAQTTGEGKQRGASALHELASRFQQWEEVTQHDDLHELADLTQGVPDIVDIRAHRVFCKADTRTPKVSLVFEDAFVVGRHPPRPSCPSAVSGSVSSIKELTDLVDTSCSRYLADRTKLQATWHSVQLERQDGVLQPARGFRTGREPQCGRSDDAHCQAADAAGSREGASAQEEEDVISVSVCQPSLSSSSRHKEDDEEGKGSVAAMDAGEAKEEGEVRVLREQTRRTFAAADALMKAMSDPSAVKFPRARRDTSAHSATNGPLVERAALPRVVPTLPEIRGCKDIQCLEESASVEFKYALSSKAGGITGAERLRHTMSAMASTLGGVICIGVSDEGCTVGQPQGEARAALRTSGFCPAMAHNAVTVREVRVLAPPPTKSVHGDSSGGERAKRNREEEGGNGEPRARMPKDWWKTPAHSLIGSPQAAGVGPTTAALPPQVARTEPQRVVTVISVARGTAPFYMSGSSTLPYLRGCASTMSMPVRVMWERVLHELAAIVPITGCG